jgi:hypothetical protein
LNKELSALLRAKYSLAASCFFEKKQVLLSVRAGLVLPKHGMLLLCMLCKFIFRHFDTVGLVIQSQKNVVSSCNSCKQASVGTCYIIDKQFRHGYALIASPSDVIKP